MRIVIKTTNIKLDKAFEDFINEKIGGLKKFLKIFQEDKKIKKGKRLDEIFVEVGKETRHHKKGPFFRAEAQVYLPGKSLRSEAIAEDLKTAIVEVKDELQQEIKKYKLKFIDSYRRKQRKLKNRLHSL